MDCKPPLDPHPTAPCLALACFCSVFRNWFLSVFRTWFWSVFRSCYNKPNRKDGKRTRSKDGKRTKKQRRKTEHDFSQGACGWCGNWPGARSQIKPLAWLRSHPRGRAHWAAWGPPMSLLCRSSAVPASSLCCFFAAPLSLLWRSFCRCRSSAPSLSLPSMDLLQRGTAWHRQVPPGTAEKHYSRWPWECSDDAAVRMAR